MYLIYSVENRKPIVRNSFSAAEIIAIKNSAIRFNTTFYIDEMNDNCCYRVAKYRAGHRVGFTRRGE